MCKEHEGVHECECNPGYVHDTLIPMVGIITDIRTETPDVKTFRVNAPEGGKLFEHMPGQCAMVCVPGVSEAMFSITSSPTWKWTVSPSTNVFTVTSSFAVSEFMSSSMEPA